MTSPSTSGRFLINNFPFTIQAEMDLCLNVSTLRVQEWSFANRPEHGGHQIVFIALRRRWGVLVAATSAIVVATAATPSATSAEGIEPEHALR